MPKREYRIFATAPAAKSNVFCNDFIIRVHLRLSVVQISCFDLSLEDCVKFTFLKTLTAFDALALVNNMSHLDLATNAVNGADPCAGGAADALVFDDGV